MIAGGWKLTSSLKFATSKIWQLILSDLLNYSNYTDFFKKRFLLIGKQNLCDQRFVEAFRPATLLKRDSEAYKFIKKETLAEVFSCQNNVDFLNEQKYRRILQ